MKYILIGFALFIIFASFYVGHKASVRARECIAYGGEIMADQLCHKMGDRIVLSTDEF